MDPHFSRFIADHRLTSENIQKTYNALSEYDPVTDPTGALASQYSTTALFFAAQIPVSPDNSFLRRDLFLFLQEKIGLPLRETDVLCTLLCSIVAIAFPIFVGPDDSAAAQQPEARFVLNEACLAQIEMYRVLAAI